MLEFDDGTMGDLMGGSVGDHSHAQGVPQSAPYALQVSGGTEGQCSTQSTHETQECTVLAEVKDG